MKRHMLWAPPMALLFACSGSAVSLQPGEWETTVRFSSIEMPGAPEAAATQMRAMMGQPQVHSECMTAEQAANPMGRMINPGGERSNCQFSENIFAGGTIRVNGTCRPPMGGTMQMSWQGSYTATTMEARVTSEMTAPPGTQGPQTIRMSGSMTGRRKGDCPAT